MASTEPESRTTTALKTMVERVKSVCFILTSPLEARATAQHSQKISHCSAGESVDLALETRNVDPAP